MRVLYMLCSSFILLSAPAWSQLPEQTVSSRVTADEPIFNGGPSMPVGLISDMMVWGNFNDSEIVDSGGAVWSFKWDGMKWVQVQKITPPNPVKGDWFGWSLAVEEQVDTGEAWLVVGAHKTDSESGAVHLYQREGDLWVFKQTLTAPGVNWYGYDVDINVDIAAGQDDFQWDLVAGAPLHRFAGNTSNTGTVFVSTLNALGLWTPGAIPLGAETLPVNNSLFGHSVALDGDVIIAGGPLTRVDGNNSAGAVIVFTRGTFSPFAGNTPVFNPDPVTDAINGAQFGTDVDVVKQLTPPRNPTGDYIFVVGAPSSTTANPHGTVYILEPGDGSAFQTLPRPENLQGNDKYGIAVKFREDLEGGDHQILACSRGPGLGASGGIYVYDQPALDQPWAPIGQLVLDGIDVAPGNSGQICQNLAAWNSQVAIAVPNSLPGNDAVYSNIVVLLNTGFEDP